MEYAKISVSFTYILASVPNFFREVAPDILYLRLGVVVFETYSYNTQSHFMFTALDKNILWHIPGLKHTTPELRLRQNRPMFAAANVEPIDLCFNIRWST